MKVLVLDRNHVLLNRGLLEMGFEIEEDYTSSFEEILKKISGFDGIIIRSRIPLNYEMLSAAKQLKFIGRVGAGLENIDIETARQLQITVFNAPEGNRDSVGEHTLGMLLMLIHRLGIANREVKTGIWKREENRGDELMGKTVGIIGYGNMGKAFAQRLKGFGTDTVFYDIQNHLADENARQVSLKELFAITDILSLHTPQTPETQKMIDRDFINAFQKPFYLLNTARGKSVVTKDLVDALKSGKIRGAALDVHEFEMSSFEKLEIEAIPEDLKFLMQSDKVILTPHIAGWTHQSKERLAQVICDKIADWKKIHNIA
ncbi:MAG: 2-hydroxyacid dehydrogenase [Weeksellaceae bacterium]